MQDDQKTILQKFDRVSSELKLNVDPKKKNGRRLNHAIVGFGQGMDYVLAKPQDDIDQIGRAIKHLKVDSTGIENTMHAIREIVERYASLVKKDRRLLIVLVTDESGDDGADLEEARQALKKYKVPLYVIGRQSLFGYPYAHHRFVDPVTKDVYHPLIRRGPETADLEVYQWDGLYDAGTSNPRALPPTSSHDSPKTPAESTSSCPAKNSCGFASARKRIRSPNSRNTSLNTTTA